MTNKRDLLFWNKIFDENVFCNICYKLHFKNFFPAFKRNTCCQCFKTFFPLCQWKLASIRCIISPQISRVISIRHLYFVHGYFSSKYNISKQVYVITHWLRYPTCYSQILGKRFTIFSGTNTLAYCTSRSVTKKMLWYIDTKGLYNKNFYSRYLSFMVYSSLIFGNKAGAYQSVLYY